MRRPKLTQYGDYAKWVTFDVMANYQVRLVLTDDLLKSAERLGSKPEGPADAFCFHCKGEGKSYIFLRHDSPPDVVAHECLHIVQKIMGWCGVIDADNEIMAYHLSHMVEAVYKFKKEIQQEQERQNVSNEKTAQR
jgi:hypothetical protein